MNSFGVSFGLMAVTAILVRIITKMNFVGKDVVGAIVVVSGAIWSADLLIDVLISGHFGSVWLSALRFLIALIVAVILHLIDRFIIDSIWLKFQSGFTGAIVAWAVWASSASSFFLILVTLGVTVTFGYYAGKWEADLDYDRWSITIVNILAFMSIPAVGGLVSAFVRDVGYDSAPKIIVAGFIGSLIAGITFGIAQSKGDYKNSMPSRLYTVR